MKRAAPLLLLPLVGCWVLVDEEFPFRGDPDGDFEPPVLTCADYGPTGFEPDAGVVDYEICDQPQLFPDCEGDACAGTDDERAVLALAREIAAERGYDDRVRFTDTVLQTVDGETEWNIYWLVVVDWYRCAGDHGEVFTGRVPDRARVEAALPRADEIPAGPLPAPGQVNAALQACSEDPARTALDACHATRCFIPGYLAGRVTPPDAGAECEFVAVSLVEPGPDGGLACLPE